MPSPRVSNREVAVLPRLPAPPKTEEALFDWIRLSLLPALDKELRYLRQVVSVDLSGPGFDEVTAGTAEETSTP